MGSRRDGTVRVASLSVQACHVFPCSGSQLFVLLAGPTARSRSLYVPAVPGAAWEGCAVECGGTSTLGPPGRGGTPSAQAPVSSEEQREMDGDGDVSGLCCELFLVTLVPCAALGAQLFSKENCEGKTLPALLRGGCGAACGEGRSPCVSACSPGHSPPPRPWNGICAYCGHHQFPRASTPQP